MSKYYPGSVSTGCTEFFAGERERERIEDTSRPYGTGDFFTTLPTAKASGLLPVVPTGQEEDAAKIPVVPTGLAIFSPRSPTAKASGLLPVVPTGQEYEENPIANTITSLS